MTWAEIGEIIAKYWIDFVLTVIAGGIGIFFKSYVKMLKKDRENGKKDYYDKLQKDLEESNKKLIDDMMAASEEEDRKIKNDVQTLREDNELVKEEISSLKKGLLAIQGKQFKEECYQLLDENHHITIEEWDDICNAHEAYNALGGNHKGDELFALVQERCKNHITK